MTPLPGGFIPLFAGFITSALDATAFVRLLWQSHIGGGMGILTGRGCSYLVKMLLHWPAAISVGAVIAAVVVVSASVGIIFGHYPAWKASRGA